MTTPLCDVCTHSRMTIQTSMHTKRQGEAQPFLAATTTVQRIFGLDVVAVRDVRSNVTKRVVASGA